MNTYDLHLLKPPSMLWVEPGFGGPESVCSLCPPQPSVYPNDTLLECCTSILDQGTVPETRWCGTPAPPSSMDTPVSGVPVQHSCPGVCAGLHGSSTVPALSRPQESRLAKKGVCGPWLWWPLCWGPSSSVLALAAVYWLQFAERLAVALHTLSLRSHVVLCEGDGCLQVSWWQRTRRSKLL